MKAIIIQLLNFRSVEATIIATFVVSMVGAYLTTKFGIVVFLVLLLLLAICTLVDNRRSGS